MNPKWPFVLLALPLLPLARAPGTGLKVDLNPDMDRKDILTPDMENWRVPDGPAATRTFGGITVTLRAVGPAGSALTTGWWKAATTPARPWPATACL